MFVVKKKFVSTESFIPNENELYDWWLDEAQYEITWSEFIRILRAGNIVYLKWVEVSVFKPLGLFNTNKSDTSCTHPNKYKNVLSRNLIFWVCPDCKKDLGDG